MQSMLAGTMMQLPVQRELAMLAALEHADNEVAGWSDLAFLFLKRFAMNRVGIFTAEDVTRASREWGLVQPPTTRAWGAIYKRAMNAGVIAHLDNEGRRENGSPCARYRGRSLK